MNELRAGIYKHYKGGLVMVIGMARHSETNDHLVAYVPLGVKSGPRITVRPYKMFFESVLVDGAEKPRFAFLAETVSDEIADDYDKLSGYTGNDRVND